MKMILLGSLYSLGVRHKPHRGPLLLSLGFCSKARKDLEKTSDKKPPFFSTPQVARRTRLA